MLESKKPMTHTAWAPYSEGGQFRRWVEVGVGRVDIESNGTSTTHVYQDRFPAGGSTYICLLPIGIRPPDPPAKPKRPHDQDGY